MALASRQRIALTNFSAVCSSFNCLNKSLSSDPATCIASTAGSVRRLQPQLLCSSLHVQLVDIRALLLDLRLVLTLVTFTFNLADISIPPPSRTYSILCKFERLVWTSATRQTLDSFLAIVV